MRDSVKIEVVRTDESIDIRTRKSYQPEVLEHVKILGLWSAVASLLLRDETVL